MLVLVSYPEVNVLFTFKSVQTKCQKVTYLPPKTSLSARAGAGSSASARGTTRGRTAHTHTAVGVRNTTVLSTVSGRSDAAVTGDIDRGRGPSKDTVLGLVTEEDVLDEGVDGVGFLGEDVVVGVGGELLGVGVVGLELLDGGDEVLVEEDLTDPVGVRGVEAADGVVLEDLGLVGGVGEDVDVGSTTGVVTGEDGLELRNTILVGLLETTEEGRVEVGLVVRVSVSAGTNTGVDTLDYHKPLP